MFLCLLFKVEILHGKGCTIQRDLTRIGEAANTSSKEGVSCLLKGEWVASNIVRV